MKLRSVLFCLCLGSALMTTCVRGPDPEHPFEALAGHDYFVRAVKPLLETRCLACHRGMAPPAGLSLVQRSSLYAPRKRDRAFVVPGDPYASRLLTSVVEGGRHPRVIGLEPLLTDPQIDVLHEWIEDGAYWPDNPAGFLQPRTSMPKKGLLDP